ncbi:MAG: DUF11 domain-containing protein, partial [Verrucomicrobia bacterium]|nr:DUF11 domain-containing protein [Verrucomicrobiota bacterium]
TAFTPSRISAAVAAILAPAPNVQVTIEGAGALTFIGDQGALTVTVTNNGSATASNVVVFVYVQNSLGVQAFGVTGGTGVTSLDTKTNTVIFDIPTLAPSASAVVTIPVQVRHADNAGPFGVIADHTTSTIFVSGYPEEGGDYRNPIPIAHGTLSIAPGSNGPTIFTPANGATFLQQTLSLTPTQWVTLPQSSGVSNNSVRTYTIPLTNPSAFLRSFTAVDSGLPSVDIFSVYAEMDDGRHNFGADSDHAIAAVHYNSPGPSGELFFSFSHVNLCYPNGNPSNITHAIANMSLPNGLPEGEPGTVIVSFPLGLCASNPPAFDLTCGWNFTSNADGALPPPTNTVRVIPFPAFMHSGEQGQPVTNIFVQEGGTNGPRNFDSSNALVNFDVPIGPWVLARTNFNNHEQGTNECAPYAVINSLEYVNSNYYNSNSLYHSPYVNPTNLTIGAMKQILHWDTNGAPSGRDSNGVPIAGALSWVDYKKAFMASNNIPIYTSEVTNAIFTNIAPVLTAISNRCDVEIRMVGHVAFVAGIRRLAGGNYSLLLAHDVLQGANGGTMVEQVKFDPYSGQITGTGWGNKFIEFVIECPP